MAHQTLTVELMKRIIICCDGTWDTPDAKVNGVSVKTNVGLLAKAVQDVKDDIPQLMYYATGVGTSGQWIKRIFDGATGYGLSKNVLNAYEYLIHNYEKGDELFLFGFSRGAFTVRSLAGLIRNSGILRINAIDKLDDAYSLYRSRSAKSHPRLEEATMFRRSYAISDVTPIKFIGVWDTVGSLGNPLLLNGLFSRRYSFHDCGLSSKIEYAYQAIAIDEKRRNFDVTLWKKDIKDQQTLEQVWFAGVHCDVGGGYPAAGLSSIALEWMTEKARDVGLGLDALDVKPDYMQVCDESRKGFYKLIPPLYRKIGNNSLNPAESGEDTCEQLHSSVMKRYVDDPTYRPKNLVEYLNVNPNSK